MNYSDDFYLYKDFLGNIYGFKCILHNKHLFRTKFKSQYYDNQLYYDDNQLYYEIFKNINNLRESSMVFLLNNSIKWYRL